MKKRIFIKANIIRQAQEHPAEEGRPLVDLIQDASPYLPQAGNDTKEMK
jgi:hypothetical protein